MSGTPGAVSTVESSLVGGSAVFKPAAFDRA
jgi:hypothetical protein